MMELEREGLQVVIADRDDQAIQEIQRQLVDYVTGHVGPSTFREMTLSIRDSEGRLIAGLNGQSNWQWLFVKMVWVSEGHRYQGLGGKLLAAAENEARKRLCTGVWLDTFSFQSPDFYKKHGYSEFGRIDEYPHGHQRHFFFKRLGSIST